MAYGLLYDFLFGQTIEAFNYFGAHFTKVDEYQDVMNGIVCNVNRNLEEYGLA